MIVVTMQLRSAISRSRDKLLGAATIAYESGTHTKGNYVFALSKVNQRGVLCRGGIKGFPRKQLLAWDLLYRVLRKARGHKNPSKKQAREIVAFIEAEAVRHHRETVGSAPELTLMDIARRLRKKYRL